GRSSTELDLAVKNDVLEFLQKHRPDVVVNAAAKVGGILANVENKLSFLLDNITIQNNLLEAALSVNAPNYVFLGSSCIYPKYSAQPMKENALLTGLLEPTNEGYALAKITGVKAIEFLREKLDVNYFSLMPTNLYGENDNFDVKTGHVLPGLIARMHEAKLKGESEIYLWGDGSPKREFMHVDDLADAVIFSLNRKLDHNLYNVGTGAEVTIRELAKQISEVTKYSGKIVWDTRKPNGTPRKLMNSKRFLSLGYKPQIDLRDGIRRTYEYYRSIKNENEI
ncbi:GDP-L-fucose synthase, partial [Akkermansiaceae bacterium]|nr:GDP-L-fucose synthase [Akkermansiaceae bacterium]